MYVGRLDRRSVGQTDGRTYRLTDGWTARWTEGRMDGNTLLQSRYVLSKRYFFLDFCLFEYSRTFAVEPCSKNLAGISNKPLYFLRCLRGSFRAPEEANIALKLKSHTSHLGPLGPSKLLRD